jgi:hypothetical protein
MDETMKNYIYNPYNGYCINIYDKATGARSIRKTFETGYYGNIDANPQTYSYSGILLAESAWMKQGERTLYYYFNNKMYAIENDDLWKVNKGTTLMSRLPFPFTYDTSTNSYKVDSDVIDNTGTNDNNVVKCYYKSTKDISGKVSYESINAINGYFFVTNNDLEEGETKSDNRIILDGVTYKKL